MFDHSARLIDYIDYMYWCMREEERESTQGRQKTIFHKKGY